MKILVIEDNPRHIEDARSFFAKNEDIEVRFAKNLHEAIPDYGPGCPPNATNFSLLKEFDGIISDIHFPLGNDSTHGWNTPDCPVGIAVAWYATSKNIPCVLITDMNHHGPTMEWINRIIQNCGSWCGLVDSVKDGQKNWAYALQDLQRSVDYIHKEKSK